MAEVLDRRHTVNGVPRLTAGDRDYGKGARPSPYRCVLPRWGGHAPAGHAMSAVTFSYRVADVNSFGARIRRAVSVQRVECGCGAGWDRTVPGWLRDDSTLRGDHAWHCAKQVA